MITSCILLCVKVDMFMEEDVDGMSPFSPGVS